MPFLEIVLLILVAFLAGVLISGTAAIIVLVVGLLFLVGVRVRR